MDHWLQGYLNAWSPPSLASQSPVSAPSLIELASDYTFPPTETTSPHQPHKKMTKQPTVKACLPNFQHHCIGGREAEGTFVQDEIEPGWSPKTSSGVPVCSKLQHTGHVFVPVRPGFQKTLLLKAISPVHGWEEGVRKGGILLSYQMSNK